MVSSDVSGGSTPQTRARVALDWGRVVVATCARGLVVTLLGLALWAAAPAAIGWSPTTVMSGSMAPRLMPGDVVVSRPVASDQVKAGRVLLADDPDQDGLLRMHRYVSDGPERTIITKGDANPQSDSTPLHRSAVHGVGYLRIPYVAAPIVWVRTGEWARVAVVVLGFVALLVLCRADGPIRRRSEAAAAGSDEPDGPGGPDGRGGPEGPSGDAGGPGTRARGGREARHRAATGLPSGESHRTATVVGSGAAPGRRAARVQAAAQHRERQRHFRRGSGVAVVVTAAVVAALLPGAAVAAPWTARTVNPGVQLATLRPTVLSSLKCTSNTSPLGVKTATVSWVATGGDAPVRTELMSGSTAVAGVTGTTASATGTPQSLTLTGGSGLSLGGSTVLTLRADYGAGWTVAAQGTTTVTVRTFTIAGIGAAAECVA
ncbi:S24/S26 family peptidase [Curtobacterium sp. CFBP9011]|uniref:S24/S26 family peptidase n=1 Tax=Curtobacterium sp. CFBP9011 TaxID=3096530 RepID=UPI002A6AD79A|nr:S24/S26 family peptidase [Curtobacterium sp. CFBP9011]MDY1005640.1 S24/S26 family peptidase [Curtobacterium sp. CFBP9011]